MKREGSTINLPTRKIIMELPLLLAVVLFIFNFFFILNLLFSHYFLPGNDPAQWLIRARYFLGKRVPPYQKQYLFSVPPISSLILASLIKVTGSPLTGMKVLAAGSYVGILISVFVLARKIFDNNWIAFFATLVTNFTQTLLLKMVAFGGLPNLLAFSFITLGIAKVSDIMHRENKKDWLLFSIFSLFILFTHTPTAAVYLLFLVLILPIFFYYYDFKPLVKRILMFALPVLVSWFLYIQIFLGGGSYSNLANFYRRGIFKLIWLLKTKLRLYELIVMIGGSVALIGFFISFLLDPQNPKKGKRQALTFWFFSLLLLVSMILTFRIKVSMVRIAYYFPLPLSVGSTRFIQVIFGNSWGGGGSTIHLSNVSVDVRKIYAGMFIFSLLAATGVQTFSLTSNAIDFYTPNEEGDIRGLLNWVEHHTEKNATIMTRWKLLGLWIEGLTGRTTFHSRGPFAFLPGQVERSRAAENVYYSRFAIANGLMTVRESAVQSPMPLDPQILAYYKGAYESTLFISNYKITIRGKKGQVERYSMEDLFPVRNFTMVKKERSAEIIGEYWANFNGNQSIEMRKIIEVERGSPVVSIHYTLTSKQGWSIKNFSMLLMGHQIEKIRRTPNGFRYSRESFDEELIPTEITLSKDFNRTWTLTRRTARMYVEKASIGSQFSYTVKIHTHPYPKKSSELKLYDTVKLLREYGVDYYAVRRSSVWYARSLYSNFGFRVTFRNAEYVIFDIEMDEMQYRDFPFNAAKS